ncbi:CRE-NAC-2 protein [Caenorhabditis remanei]|uniref:CRE-NAC-2 protein n=1 Tax=Caenorhabditis remanei TaxID=31234 RepID=E3NFZ3_CAERE|nr:CRE-NAC-2 protein [Caenorhabditis remanei]
MICCSEVSDEGMKPNNSPQRLLIRKILVLLGPLVAVPLLFFGPEYRCLFSIIFLSTYWIGEAFPIGVTSLFPLALYPILQIVPSKQISPVYFKDSIVLFMCTLIMAMAVEATGLHRRIALKLLTKVGAKQPVMLLGFMCITSLISFFVSDTACTALMCPTAVALLMSMADAVQHLKEGDKKLKPPPDDATIAEKLRLDEMAPQDSGFCKAMILACAHASLIGGTAIITSTGPNLVFRENINKRYPEGQITMTYLQWMVFAIPPMFFYLIASYLILVCYFMGPSTLVRWFEKPTKEEAHLKKAVEKNIQSMYEDLGDISWGEKSVFTFFVILIGSWISRDPGFTTGWGDLLPHKNYLSDSVSGVLISCLLFVWPKDPFDPIDPTAPILKWTDMKSKFSWSCTLLIGAGYAISEGVDKSGLSQLISCGMRKIFIGMSSIPLQCKCRIPELNHKITKFSVTVTTTIVIMTEFASNVSTGSIFIPIALGVAESMGVHPLYLALPTTVACSFAFMLPISTPPNAIVYDTKVISMIEMIVCGFLLNIACIIITSLNMNTWTYFIFSLNNFPENISISSSNSSYPVC